MDKEKCLNVYKMDEEKENEIQKRGKRESRDIYVQQKV